MTRSIVAGLALGLVLNAAVAAAQLLPSEVTVNPTHLDESPAIS